MTVSARNLITGERLQALADVTILTEEVYQFHRSLPTIRTKLMGFQGPNQAVVTWDALPVDVQRAQIIFVYTHLLEDFFRAIFPALRQPIVLLSHNSDHSVDERFLQELSHPKLVTWYAQNALLNHPKLHSIPIGIANAQWVHGDLAAMARVMAEDNPKTKLAYMNFSVTTNVATRTGVQETLAAKNFVTLAVDKPFEDYLRDLSSHRFCISPPGNGADCHRVWECLYLGVIPIVQRDANITQYEDLPILVVDDWNTLNEPYLQQQYERFKDHTWNREKLKVEYWRHRLQKSRQQALSLA